MADREIIRAEIERLKLCTMDEHMGFYSEAAEAEYNALCNIEHFIDSLQEEPVSEDLQESAETYTNRRENEKFDVGEGYGMDDVENAFKAGAQWQKNLLPKWKKTPTGGCWSGEIGVNPTKRMFTYEHYSINADKMFELLDK